MTIKLTKLPPRKEHRGSVYGYEGMDATYEIENRLGEWKVVVVGHDVTKLDSESFNTLAEARAFVEGYDNSVGEVGDHVRWDAGYEAALFVRTDRYDAQLEKTRTEADRIFKSIRDYRESRGK